MYWDINKPLSYNALFNFIVGNRGCGKTYGTKRHAIKRFLRFGEQFIYIRRFQTELKGARSFFNDIQDEFPDTEFGIDGNTFLIDGAVAGYALALTKAKIEKSTAYPNVGMIIFDEFILDKGFHHYLPDEVVAFLELYETIARTRDGVRVMFLANAVSFTNPYFLYFNVTKPRNNEIVCKNDILVQFVAEPEFIAMKKQTRFAKLVQGTDYAAYSIDNEMLRDNDSFVLGEVKNKHYFFTIKSDGKLYGVWWSSNTDFLWVSEQVDPSYSVVYTTRLDDHTPNTMLLKGVSKSEHLRVLEKSFKMGLVYFDSVKTKNVIMDTLRFLGR